MPSSYFYECYNDNDDGSGGGGSMEMSSPVRELLSFLHTLLLVLT